METIVKFSVMLILSLTWTTKTNSYEPSLSVPAVEIKCEEAPACQPQELDGFWLTNLLLVDN